MPTADALSNFWNDFFTISIIPAISCCNEINFFGHLSSYKTFSHLIIHFDASSCARIEFSFQSFGLIPSSKHYEPSTQKSGIASTYIYSISTTTNLLYMMVYYVIYIYNWIKCKRFPCPCLSNFIVLLNDVWGVYQNYYIPTSETEDVFVAMMTQLPVHVLSFSRSVIRYAC